MPIEVSRGRELRVVARSGMAGSRCRSRYSNDQAGGPTDSVRTAPVLPDDEQLRLVVLAESAREGSSIEIDRRKDVPSLADPYAVLTPDIGEPHRPLGVQADPVRVLTRRVGPHPSVEQPTVVGDLISRQPLGVGLRH